MNSTVDKDRECQQAIADRDWWRRIGTMFRSRLIGFTYRIRASFTPPLGECSGLVARRLVELDDCARQLQAALTDMREWHRSEYQSSQAIDEAADADLATAAQVLGVVAGTDSEAG